MPWLGVRGRGQRRRINPGEPVIYNLIPWRVRWLLRFNCCLPQSVVLPGHTDFSEKGAVLIVKKPTIENLRELVERACRDNPHLTSRLERAAFLLILRPIVVLGDHHYQVGSEDGLRNLEVLNGHCQCSDYVRNGSGHPCKHRLAISLYQRLGGLGLPAPPLKGGVMPADPLYGDASAS